MTDKIRDFFRKKKTEQKFKQAGPGHKLSEAKPEPKKTVFAAAKPSGNNRSKPIDGAKRAAAQAALARDEAHKQQKRVPNWSLEAIRAQARKELEQEAQAQKQESIGPQIVSVGSAPVLAVSGVFYHCPMVGPDVLPRREMQDKIKEFLYEQLEFEPGLTACLIIRTCNPNKEKVRQGVDTICTYLRNIVENPSDEKYQKIRLQNRAFQERVSCLEGSLEILQEAGFYNSSDGEFLIFNQEKLSDLGNLEVLMDALKTAEAIVPELDRNTRVLLPREALANVRLPDEFFNLTADEVRREQDRRAEEVEVNSLLMTKAMREKAAQKELRMYRYTLIRIKFPDEIILQGTFKAGETLLSVFNFIQENLADPFWQFQLSAPGGHKLDDDCINSTLLDLSLIPAVMLHLSWLGSMEDVSKSTGEAFLKPETMALLQSL